jgi:hypothetical protein
VYCGFKPAFVLIKCTSTTGDWIINDATRNTYNPVNLYLEPNTSDADGAYSGSNDFLSNGFKVNTTHAPMNTNSATYIFAAFAAQPFQGDDGYTQARAR